MIRAVRLVLAFVFCVSYAAWALQAPDYTGPLTDRARLLSDADRLPIEKAIADYRAATGHEIAVLIIPSLDGESLEDFTRDVFKKWGVGREQEDDGVLFLMAVEEKKVRLEVGYGLEAALTDVEAGRLVSRDSEMAAAFRQGNWGHGIQAVVEGIIQAIGGEYDLPPTKEPAEEIPFELIMFALLIGFSVVAAIGNAVRNFRKKKKGQSWTDFFSSGGSGGFGGFGGFGGGFSGGGGGFSFGGGSSGGGGASGGW